MAEFDIIAAATSARSRAASAQRLLNLYMEKQDQGVVLYGTPGLRLWATVGTGPIRGMKKANNGFAYVVSGTQAFKVAPDGTATLLGTVAGTGPVALAENGVQMFVAAGKPSYIITLATGVIAEITDEDFPGAAMVGFLDGFFLFNEPGTGRFWATSAYDGSMIDPLDFATAEGAPDPLMSLLIDHREIWLFGTDTTEVWYNGGNPDFPFERVNGAFIEHGCAATFSVAKADNTVFWLGQDENGRGVVWRAEGYTPSRVSTHEIENKLSRYQTVSDAVAWVYQQDGHLFYVLNFPTENATWAYDIATGTWAERGYRNPEDGLIERHRGQNHMAFASMNLVGDHTSGKIYELDPDCYEDDGQPIVREVVAPHSRTGKRAFYAEAEIRMESGVGLTEGQGSEPQIMLQMSDDAGRTWGSEHWRPMGKIGEYLTRAVWRRLGSAFNRTFRIRITDPVPVCLVNARVEFTQ